MFYINSTSENIVLAKQLHLENMRCYINRKIGAPNCPNNQCLICKSGIRRANNLPKKIEEFFSDPINVEYVIAGEPEDLLLINEEFWKSIFPSYQYTNWKPFFDINNIKNSSAYISNMTSTMFIYIRAVKQIINYDWFIDIDNKYYHAYDLSKTLARNTCTYCNRVYTSTMITRKGKRLMRPTFDHWFPKFQAPLLAMSFHNLIPSCSYCNSSIKGVTDLNLTENTHPYVDTTQLNDFSFSYMYLNNLDEYRIYIKASEFSSVKAYNTLQTLKMNEIYDTHHDELKDLIKIKTYYSDTYIDQIRDLFGKKLSYDEVYRLLFGVEYDSQNFYKKPLSKFKHDILSSLGIKK